MAGIRADFALIQPIVYPTESWVRLRRRLADTIRSGGSLPAGLDGTLHLRGTSQPLFGDGLGDATSLPEAFPKLLGEASAFPCIATIVPATAGWAAALDERAPPGVIFDAAVSHLVIGRSGEIQLLHLASGIVDAEAGSRDDRGLQHGIRAAWTGLLAAEAPAVFGFVDRALERLLGAPAPESAADVAEPSGGHLFTAVRGADDRVLERLKRVHRIQEGSTADESALLMPDGPDGAGWAHFGWAYSTVALPDAAPALRLLFPLIGVNQPWYRYRRLRGDLIEMSREIQALESDRELVARTDFYNEVVLDIRVWEAEREAFARGLRPMYRSVYDRLWDYWDTGESRETVLEGIDVLRDFLDRKYNVKIAIRENTQSRILFVIAIFQLLSVFGLISGYLYFWEVTPLPESAIYESDWMMWAVVVSPIIVLVLIGWLLWDFFRRHR